MKTERFADRLFHLADEAGLTQTELAARAMVGKSLVSRAMSGKRSLTRKAAARLAAALNITPHTLLVGTDAEHLLDEKGQIERTADLRELIELRTEIAQMRAEIAAARAERAALKDLRERLSRLEPELRAITSALSRLAR